MKLVIKEIDKSDLRVIQGGGQPEEPKFDSDAFGPDMQEVKNYANEAVSFLKVRPPDIQAAIQKLEELIQKL